MKFGKIENWSSDFRADGMLFFTQRIREMLFIYADPIFKSPVLNSYLLVKEYLETAELVQNETINPSHLSAILEEFQQTFSADIVIQENISKEEQTRFLHRLNSASGNEKQKLMEYAQYLLKDYNSWCKSFLKMIVPKEKEKKKIERALKCFVPGLIGAGYSQEFIYYCNKKVFKETTVESYDSLNTFLDRFDFLEREYTVFMAVEKDSIEYKSILEKKLRVHFEPFEAESKLKYDKSKFILISVEIEALDERAAANRAFIFLSLFFKFYYFISDQQNEWFFNTAEVLDNTGNVAYVDLKHIGLMYNKIIEKSNAANATDLFVSSLLKNKGDAFFTIDRAVNAHNIAIADKDLRNRFLNLWSVLEILFVSEGNNSKINEIEKKLIPILTKDYCQIMADTLVEYMRDNASESDIKSIIACVGNENSIPWEWSLIGLKNQEEARQQAYLVFSDYPLIRTRINTTYELLSDKRNFEKAVTKYRQRVQWHLKRLYRTRNIIIHSGDSPMFLESLVEHLHCYVDEGLMEIIWRLSVDKELNTIDNVIIQMQMNEEAIAQMLKSGGKMTAENLQLLRTVN